MFRLLKWGRVAFAILSAGAGTPVWGEIVGFAYVTTSGTSNNVSAYGITGETGALVEMDGSPYPAGSQPVSVAADPTGQFVYVTNLVSSDISAYSIDGIYGYLTEIDGSPFRQMSGEVDPRSVVVHPLGEYAYVANEGAVAGYRIDAITGALERIAGSPFPTQRSQAASVALDPAGRFAYVASVHSSFGGISAYTIGPATGTLIGVSGSPYYSPRSPISVAVDPTGQYAYVANSNGGGPGSVSGYHINQTTGQLTAFVTDPFPAPYMPSSIAITLGPPVDPLQVAATRK